MLQGVLLGDAAKCYQPQTPAPLCLFWRVAGIPVTSRGQARDLEEEEEERRGREGEERERRRGEERRGRRRGEERRGRKEGRGRKEIPRRGSGRAPEGLNAYQPRYLGISIVYHRATPPQAGVATRQQYDTRHCQQ